MSLLSALRWWRGASKHVKQCNGASGGRQTFTVTNGPAAWYTWDTDTTCMREMTPEEIATAWPDENGGPQAWRGKDR